MEDGWIDGLMDEWIGARVCDPQRLESRGSCCGSPSRAPKKRRRAAAVQDAARGTLIWAGAKRLGLRQPSGALSGTAFDMELADEWAKSGNRRCASGQRRCSKRDRRWSSGAGGKNELMGAAVTVSVRLSWMMRWLKRHERRAPSSAKEILSSNVVTKL